jgi:hypothetical protein
MVREAAEVHQQQVATDHQVLAAMAAQVPIVLFQVHR